MRCTSRALVITSATLALVGLAFASAIAGNHHTGSTLICSDCHATHTGAIPGMSDLTDGPARLPSLHLIKSASTTLTCLQCHDGQPGTPDVVGPDVNNPFEVYDGTERAAGQFSEGIAANWKGHSLPGQGSKPAGECTGCHDPHGNENHRNLRAMDGSEVGPVAFVNPSATGLDRYRRSNVGYVKNMGDKLCMGCHNFGAPDQMLAPGGGGRFQRHPSSSGQMMITMSGAHSDGRHWLEGTGSGFTVHGNRVPRLSFAVSTATDYYRATTIDLNDEVFCLSCHKAHGSVHAYGMQWPYGSDDIPAATSGCNQCHNISGD